MTAPEKKRGPGRPKLDKDRIGVYVRCEADELAAWKEAADHSKTTVSRAVRVAMNEWAAGVRRRLAK